MKTTVYKASLIIYIKLNPKLMKGHNANVLCMVLIYAGELNKIKVVAWITVLQSSCKISIFVFFVYRFSKNHSHRLIISAKFKFHKICSKLMEKWASKQVNVWCGAKTALMPYISKQ